MTTKSINRSSIIISSILLAITVCLIGLYPRTIGISATSIFSLSFITFGGILLTVGIIGFVLKNLRLAGIFLPLVSILLISISLIIFGHTIAEIGLQLVIGLFVGLVLGLFWRSQNPSFVIPLILLGILMISPSILWPQFASSSVLFATFFLNTIVIGAYSIYSLSSSFAASYRVFIYCCWLIFLIYFVLAFGFGFWGSVIGIGGGTFFAFVGAMGLEESYQKYFWLIPKTIQWQTRWAIMSLKHPNEKDRKNFMSDLANMTIIDQIDNSVTDINLWLTKRSLQMHQVLEDILNYFDQEFLLQNPAVSQIAQEALLDLPESITKRPIYLHLEQLVRLDLTQDLPEKLGAKFGQDFLSKIWPNYLRMREKTINDLRNSGELNKRLGVVLPNQKMAAPYSPNGIFLDYGKWPDGKPDNDWETVLKEDLHSNKFFPPGSSEIRILQEFLNWISQIKSLRTQLLEVIQQRDKDPSWQNYLENLASFGDRGFEETLAFVDLLQRYQMYFEAIDLLEALQGYYDTPFTRKTINQKFGECEIGCFVQKGWAKPTKLNVNKTSNQNWGEPQLRLVNNSRAVQLTSGRISVTPGTDLHILVQGSSVQRFALSVDQTKAFTISPGDYKIFVYPKDIAMPPVQATWSVDDASCVYNLSMELLAPKMEIPNIIFSKIPSQPPK